MRRYRSEAADVLETLAYLVQGLVSDGLDLEFTLGGVSSWHSNNAASLKEEMYKEGNGPTENKPIDIAYSLDLILSRYLSLFRKKKTIQRPPRTLSIYVLTDGIWSNTKIIYQSIM
jgi:hypothetical protein